MLKLGTFKISYVFTLILVLILSLFLNITFLAINSIFLKMLKHIFRKFFFYFCIIDAGNLNQYRGTVGLFNNHNIAICNFCNIWYSQSFRNSSTFIFFNAIFICSVYPFTPQEFLKSSFLSSLRVKCRTSQTCLNLILNLSILVLYANHFWLDEIVLKLGGDTEENPGPKPSSKQSFSICHWNLNSISAHNYIKVSLLRAYISTHKFDMICFSEAYLNFDTSDDDDNLKIEGYNLILADHPSSTKQGGVCIYYKHSLGFKLLNIHYLKECMNFEISFGGKICNFISLYRSPSRFRRFCG